MVVLKVLALACVLALTRSSPVSTGVKVRFDGHKLFRLHPTNEDHIHLIQQLLDNPDIGLDFWTEGVAMNRPVDVRVPPYDLKDLLSLLEEQEMKYEVLKENLQEDIDKEEESNHHERKRRQQITSEWIIHICTSANPPLWCSNFGSFTTAPPHVVSQWDIVGTYATFEQVNTWLASKASQHSTIASLESIGKTYEGRDMKVLKIGEAANKPAIWIDAALHAREWIASATLIYIADQLLNEYSSNANINKFTWYILPIANPDGYEYSYNYNRFWRKTRTRNAADYRGTCPGVDPNRNWGFHFGEAGTSNNPCSDIYRGETAFSEKCVFNMKTFLYNKRKQIKVYISFHSYGQMFMTPWGYTHTSAPSDIRELTRVANLAKTAIKNVNGKSYSVGSPGSLLYDAAGGSFDWAKGVAGIKYAYTLELRPADNTSGGFAIPASEILPTGRETYAAVKEVAKRVTV